MHNSAEFFNRLNHSPTSTCGISNNEKTIGKNMFSEFTGKRYERVEIPIRLFEGYKTYKCLHFQDCCSM